MQVYPAAGSQTAATYAAYMVTEQAGATLAE
jgi:hypothetical protein